MKFKIFFSPRLVSEANSRLSGRKGEAPRRLPDEVDRMIEGARLSSDEIRSAFTAASLRLKKA